MSDAAGVGAFLIEGDRSLHILFGSQSGNSEILLQRLERSLQIMDLMLQFTTWTVLILHPYQGCQEC